MSPYIKSRSIKRNLTLFLLLCITCAVQSGLCAPAPLYDVELKRAWGALRDQDFKLAADAINTFPETQPFSTRKALLNATLFVERGEYDGARKVFARLQSSEPIASALGLRIALEFEYLNSLEGKKLNQQKIKFLKDRAEDSGIDTARANAIYLEAILKNQAGDTGATLRLCQSLWQRYPRTLAGVRALRFEKLFWSRVTEFYRPQDRIAALAKLRGAGFVEEALEFQELLAKHLSDFSASEKIAFYRESFGLLRGEKEQKKRVALIQALSKSSDPKFRELVFIEEAKAGWLGNDYQRAETNLSTLARDSEWRNYLTARIDEERGQGDAAYGLYKKLVFAKEKEIATASLKRLIPLALLRNDTSVKLPPLSQIITRDDADYSGLLYWSTKIRNRPVTSTFDLRTPYYWYGRGGSFLKPKVASQKNPLKSCKITVPVLSKNKKTLLEDLLHSKLFQSAGEELRIAFPLSKFSRIARAFSLHAHGLFSEAIREISGAITTLTLQDQACAENFLNLLYPLAYAAEIQVAAEKYKIDPALLQAIIRTESNYDPLAESMAGAEGLMQVMPATFALEGFPELSAPGSAQAFAIAQNIEVGAKHLRRMLDKYGGRYHLAIAAYNAGSAAVDRWLTRHADTWPEVWTELIPYAETKGYVRKVFTAYWIYRQEYGKKN
jgi:hypothetical protein